MRSTPAGSRLSLLGASKLYEPGGWLYALETLGLPWATGGLDDPVRRLQMLEMIAAFEMAGFVRIECTYRFRDRVILRAHRP